MSKHNHPQQEVGNQYNADAINIHHHNHQRPDARSGAKKVANRVDKQLEDLKRRCFQADETELYSILEEAEDFLIFICGEKRAREFIAAAHKIRYNRENIEGYKKWYSDWERNPHLYEEPQLPDGQTRWNLEVETRELHQSLLRKISGLEFRPKQSCPHCGGTLGG